MENYDGTSVEDLTQSALRKGRDTPMTTEEALHVWDRVFEIMKTDPDGSTLIYLFRRLEGELDAGTRCGVCGAYQDPNCSTDC
jgi:hypothetical protein